MSLPVFALDKLEFQKIREALSAYLFTPVGERLIRERKPSGKPEEVERRLEEAAEMMHLLNASEPPPFQTLYDVSGALSKARIERFILDGKNIAQIGKWVESARLLHRFFARHQETTGHLWEVARALTPIKELEQQISCVVDEKGEVKEDASLELARINKRILAQKQSARSALQRILGKGKESGMIGDEEVTLRGGRLVIPVKAEFKRKVNGFIHDTSATGQTVYIEPVEVFEKNNEIRELESARNREVERLLRELTTRIGQYSDVLIQNAEQIGYLDACYAGARLGIRWNGVIPEITGDGSLVLKECRNPLLLLKFKQLDDGLRHVVPLHLEMEPVEKGIIITGPNAGGKSVTLKTFGLALMLAQSGIPISALEGAKLPCVTGLYIDMGDEQSIDNDLSTFSSRLSWMKEVLIHAKPGSWVLMDEAGSGTDPEEGTALVKSFLKMLSEKGMRSIVTTHHGALKIFAHETEGWENASMEFDQESLSPTYRFKKGIPGSSYAFEIADRLEVPGELTRYARKMVGSGKSRMESLILRLEQESQQLQHQKTEIARQEQSWKVSKEELDRRLSRIREEREQIRSRAVEEAEELLQNVNRKIEEAIRAASERDKQTLKEKRKEIGELDRRVHKKLRQKKKQQKKSEPKLGPPQTGDPVRLIDTNTTGELVEISGRQATVNINGLRFKTRYDNLVRSDQLPAEKPSKGYKLTVSGSVNDMARPFSGSLNIRGKRGEEAMKEVTRFVDEGLARGMKELMIIHGKGDGILKRLVHEHLQSRSDVKHFEHAPIQEGGEGCTCVYL